MNSGSESSRPGGRAGGSGPAWVDHVGPTTVATPHQVEQLNRDGYFVLDQAFHRDTMDEVTLALSLEAGLVDVHVASRPDEAPADVLRRFCSHPLLAGLARDLVGPDARVAGDESVVIPPGRGEDRPFRQDVGPRSTSATSITCWVALTDAAADGGCLQIARGRHRRGLLQFDLTDTASPDPAAGIDPVVVIDVAVKAGSVVVMSSLTPRRVRPNATSRVALAYAIRYAPDLIDLDEHAPSPDTRRQFPVVRGGQLVGPS